MTQSKTQAFTVDEIKEGCANLWGNVECLTCSRLLGYIKDLLPGDGESAARPSSPQPREVGDGQ